MRLADLVRSARGSPFVQDIAKLSFGTLAGRLISVAILPLLTRLYSPADFAVLATYLAILATVAVAACLRFDVAVPLADDDEDAANLLALALVALATVTSCILIVVLLIPGQITTWLGNTEIRPYLMLVPLGIGLAGTYSVFQNWTTRVRRFGHIARTRITQSVLGAVTNLSLGWVGIAPFGLLLGNALGIGAGGVGLAGTALRKEGDLLRRISLRRMRDSFRRYRRYPIFSTPDSFLNIAGQQVPILLIAAHAGTEAGFLLLAVQLMSAPMALLGSSISQVYVSRAPEALREGRLAELTLSIMKRLALMSIGPLALVGALAPAVIPLVFGSEWERTGVIIVWMVPSIALQFIASPVSMVMLVTERQRQLLLVRTLSVLSRVGAVGFAAIRFDGRMMVESFAIANAVVYAIMGLLFVNAARRSRFQKANNI